MCPIVFSEVSETVDALEAGPGVSVANYPGGMPKTIMGVSIVVAVPESAAETVVAVAVPERDALTAIPSG